MAQTVVINHIDEICKRKNITVKQLSIDSHIGERQLLRIRKGQISPALIDALSICQALGQSCEEVFEKLE